MEMKFDKKPLLYMQSITRKLESQEQTQQVRLSESMPDIDVILGAWGQVILRSKEWHSNHIQVSGGSAVKVLYMSKEKQPICVEMWLPFQVSVDLPASHDDGTIVVRPFLRAVDARTLSDRKLSVRSTVGLSIDAMISCETHMYRPEETGGNLQMLHNVYPVQLAVESGEKLFYMEEPVDIGHDAIILRQTLETFLTESKIIADKLVMRGTGILEILYLDENGDICSWNKEIPISHYAELFDEYDSGSTADICFAVTELELERNDQTGFTVKLGLLAQYTISDRKDISVAEDAYLPGHNIEIESVVMQIPAILSVNQYVVHPEAEVQLEGHRILDITTFLEELKPEFEGNSLIVRPTGTFYVLSMDQEGNYSNTSYRWGCEWQLDASPDIEADIIAMFEGNAKIHGNKVSIPLRLKMSTTKLQSIQTISNITLGDPTEPEPNRPSLILRKIGNDTLWQLAKNTGSTIEEIKRVNSLQQEPSADQLLLIPLS